MENILIRPFKTIGAMSDCIPFNLYTTGDKQFVAMPTYHSFKIFDTKNLKVTFLGPTFDQKIRHIACINEKTFLFTKSKFYLMSYNHILYHIDLDVKPSCHLVLPQVLVFGSEYQLTLINLHPTDYTLSEQMNIDLDFTPQQLVHPPTYLNKILIVSKNQLELWNIQNNINWVECSPVIDVVAIGWDKGHVWLYDIRQDKQIGGFSVQNEVISIAFSRIEYPLLAVGDSQGYFNYFSNFPGNITIWDLNESEIFSFIEKAHQKGVSCLQFQLDQMIFISSSNDNSIKQWVLEEFQDKKFSILRQRYGVKYPLKQLKFVNDIHILASTLNNEAELRDFSILNECMSQNYSLKTQSQKKLDDQFLNTETNSTYNLSQIEQFSFSTNRIDWPNLLTTHKNSEKPCLFNTENKSIIKQKIKKQVEFEGLKITACFVTYCGNFGVLGFSDGRIVKFNMQSGKLNNDNFINQHKTKIQDLYVNNYNKYLISACIGNLMVIWDFYSAQVYKKIQMQNKITFIKGAHLGQNFLLALDDYTIEVWDFVYAKRGRRFIGHKTKILDAVFTQNNKQVISSSQDNNIQIWDVVNNKLIQDIRLNKPVISIDISPDNQLIATCFQGINYQYLIILGSREINIWHNLIESLPWSVQLVQNVKFQSPLSINYFKGRNKFYNANIKSEISLQENQDNKSFKITQLNDQSLITFTILPSGKWQPLIYLDEIKERNKPKNMEEFDFKMPFFLDFEKKDEIREQMVQEYKDSVREKSKILKKQKEQFLDELEEEFDRIIKVNETQSNYEKISQKLLYHLKKLTPSQIGYQLKKYTFGKHENIQNILEIFKIWFLNNEDFDLKNAYLNCFIKGCSDEIMSNIEFLDILKQIGVQIKQMHLKIQEKVMYSLCLAEKFALDIN